MAGTSMAAPAVAAMLTVIREYFREGYYPAGYIRNNKTGTNNNHSNVSFETLVNGWGSPLGEDDGDGFIPSGALLKAVLVHSGQRMSTLSSTSKSTKISGYPSVVQGYGRAVLSSTLYFSENNRSADNEQRLFVIGSAFPERDKLFAAFDTENQTHRYVLTTSSVIEQTRLRVTLCFTDYPGCVLKSRASVNLLSLEVVSKTIRIFPYSALYALSYDDQNVQVIDIDSPSPDTNYSILISAKTLIVTPQSYSLVVTGMFFPVSHAPLIESQLPPDLWTNAKSTVPQSQTLSKVTVLFLVLLGVTFLLGLTMCSIMW
jgi:hypothetical protein